MKEERILTYKSFSASLAALLAGCAAPVTPVVRASPVPVWVEEPPTRGHGPYTSGLLMRRGNCLVIENVDGALFPIWPAGTDISERAVITPNLRGHRPLIIGGRAGVHGRYLIPNPASTAERCAPRAFLVDRANRVYLADNAVEAAAESDAVLLAEILSVDISEPLADGFLSTVRVRVVEVLRGELPVGSVINLRHAGGRTATGEWLGPADDPLIEPFSGTKLKAGDQLLLFVNQDLYRQAAEGRGGHPVAGHTAASLNRVIDGRIVEAGGLPLPETVSELRIQLRGQ